MNNILGLNLGDILRGEQYENYNERINDLIKFISETKAKDAANKANATKDESKGESKEVLKYGDKVTYIYKQGVVGSGTYYGSINGEHLCKDLNDDIHIAYNIRKLYRELSKQEAKNKICNILETQANPSTIQKVIDIIDRINKG